MARPKNPVRTDTEAAMLGAMAEAGISDYSALATASGVNQSTIQRICSEKMDPSLSTLKKLAKAIGCKVDDIVSPY